MVGIGLEQNWKNQGNSKNSEVHNSNQNLGQVGNGTGFSVFLEKIMYSKMSILSIMNIIEFVKIINSIGVLSS